MGLFDSITHCDPGSWLTGFIIGVMFGFWLMLRVARKDCESCPHRKIQGWRLPPSAKG